IWYDDTVKRLNTDERGKYIGAFISDDKILTIQKSGNYKLMNYDLSNHFEEDMILIEKFNPKKIISAIYFDAAQEVYYLKRFQIENGNDINKKIDFIGDQPGNLLHRFSFDYLPRFKVLFDEKANKKEIPELIVSAEEFVGVKSFKAKGKRITTKAIEKIEFIEPLPYEEPEEKLEEQLSDESIPPEEDIAVAETGEDEAIVIQPNTEPKPDAEKTVPAVKKKKPGDDPDGSKKQMELF
ncbi:MAG: hypothetical protein R2764_26185, partial [Bacteroidales bacterium]